MHDVRKFVHAWCAWSCALSDRMACSVHYHIRYCCFTMNEFNIQQKIRFVDIGICPITEFTMTEPPYFYFRFKIWRYHYVRWPRFPIWRENFGDSQTFESDIALFMFAWIFRTSWPKVEVIGAKQGKGWCDIYPQPIRSYFWGLLSCSKFCENRSRNAIVRVRTDGQTQTGFIICPMLLHSCYEADKNDPAALLLCDVLVCAFRTIPRHWNTLP